MHTCIEITVDNYFRKIVNPILFSVIFSVNLSKTYVYEEINAEV